MIKKWHNSLCLLGIFFLISLQNISAQSVESLYIQQGNKKVQTGLYEEALIEYDKAIAANAYAYEAYYYKSEACRQLGRYTEALANLDKAIQLKPENPLHYVARGNIRLEINLYELAVADFTQAINRNYSDALCYLQRAEAYLQMSATDKALADCDKALKINPASASAYHIRGKIYIQKNSFQNALSDLQNAIIHDSHNSKYYTSLANLYRLYNQSEKAFEYYAKALEINPKDSEAYFSRADAYLETKKYALAREDAQKAILNNRRCYTAYVVRSIANYQLGALVQAETDKDFYLKSAYAAKDYYEIAARFYQHIVEKDLLNEAESWIVKALSLEDTYKNQFLYASILYKLGKTDLALPAAQKALLTAKNNGINTMQADQLVQTLTSNAAIDRQAPAIQITFPVMASRGFVVVDDIDEITITGKVADQSGIAKVLVNGNIARLEYDGSFAGKTILEYDENLIVLIATDKMGNSAEQRFVIKKQKTTATTNNTQQNNVLSSGSTNTFGKHRALLFATNDYDYWSDLVNPLFDADAIGRDLKDLYGFEVEIVRNATRQDVLLKLREYAKFSYQDQDQLFIMFAGHGQYDELSGDGYLVTKDSKLEDIVKTTYVPFSQLRTIISNISCKHILLTMDVCFGGTFDPLVAQRGQEDFTSDRMEFINRKMKYKTRRYISSGGKEYVPDGRPGQHSPFARKFLEALRSEGGMDKILTLDEIAQYLQTVTPRPLLGEFDNNEPGSDFLFITR